MNNRVIGIVIGSLIVGGIAVWASTYARYAADRAYPPSTSDERKLVQPHSPTVGRVDAPVTIVEFFDPACEGCRAFHPVVKSILAEFPDEVRIVYRYVPFHRGSEDAVRILEAARKQGRFEPVLDALFAQQTEWATHGREDSAKAWDIAGAAGLDLERAREEAASRETDRVVETDLADARGYRIQQTPTFVVNQTPLESYSAEELRSLVQNELTQTLGTPE
jgi:protein-disulfide isomerase